jgi:hypothetical protein
MPKANPLAKITKKLSALQVKSDKLNAEIKSLTVLAADAAKKAALAPAPAKVAARPTAKVAVKAKAKVAPASNGTAKRSGRPRAK